MDLKDYLIQIADRIVKTKDNVLTEEATKMSFLNAVDGKGERDKTLIKSLDEIYNYSDEIVESLKAVVK